MGPLLPDDVTINEVISEINATKEKFFHCAGGLRLKYEYSATINHQKRFAFLGPASVEQAILWPKYLVDATGIQVDDSRIMKRVSVYDFLDHQTTAIDQLDKHVFITPERHMFSSGFSSYMKMLQWSEGYQNFHLGSTAVDFTIPECFSHSDYKNTGEVAIDGVRCICLSSSDDDIWIAVDNGYFIKQREMRYPGTSLLKERVEVAEYKELPGMEEMRIPWIIRQTEFSEPGIEPDGVERILRQFELKMLRAEAGAVKAEEFNLAIPPGAYVEDLFEDKHYYIN